MSGRRMGVLGSALVIAGAVLIGAAGVLAARPGVAFSTAPGPMMGSGATGMLGGAGAGVLGSGSTGMGGAWNTGTAGPGPGEAGFVAGTASAPRVVRILALPNLRFIPDAVRVQAGEAIRFEVTAMGLTTHEFMVGPAADVAADKAGTPEIADLTMMQTGSLTYTFNGNGPFAFACHATGHYEAGMIGTILVVS